MTTPNIQQNRWFPRDDELAARIELKNLRGWLIKDLILEDNQRLLLTEDGRPIDFDASNKYTFLVEDFGERIARWIGLRGGRRFQALIFEGNNFKITFDYADLFTKDPYRVGMTLDLTFKIADPRRFLAGLVRRKTVVTKRHIRNELHNDLYTVVQDWIGSRTLKKLTVTLNDRNRLETAIEAALDSRDSNTLRELGLKLVQLRSFNYTLIASDRLNKLREEYLIKRTELDTKLQGEKELFELLTVEQLAKIRADEVEVELYTKRAHVRAVMRQAVLSDKFDELKSEGQMEQFLRDLDKQKLIADDEWDRFKRTMKWKRDADLQAQTDKLAAQMYARRIEIEDRDRDRAHLLSQIDLENQYEIAKLELAYRADFEPDQLAYDQSMAMQRLQNQQVQALARLENDHALRITQQMFQLDQQRRQREADEERVRRENELRREQLYLDELARNKVTIEQQQRRLMVAEAEAQRELLTAHTAVQRASAQAKIREIERKEDEADARLGILLLDEMKAVRRKDERERDLMRLEREERQLAMQMTRETQQFEFQMRRMAAVNTQRLAVMDKSRGMTREEMLFNATADAAAQLTVDKRVDVEMQRAGNELFAGLSAEERLAQLDPQAYADMMAARANAQMMSANERRIYEAQSRVDLEARIAQAERYAAQRREDERLRDERLERQARRTDDRDFRATELRGQAEIERAKKVNPTPPPTSNIIVTGSGGTMGSATVVGGGGSQSGIIYCTQCSKQNPPNANFCGNCGNKLRGG